MNRLIFLLVLVAMTVVVSAHRLDECLQAARVSISRELVQIRFSITPGVEVIDSFLVVLDGDQSGDISREEARGYATTLAAAIGASLDDDELKLVLSDVKVPRVEDMKQGAAAIEVELQARYGRLATGAHWISLTNHHLPLISVYQVNATIPQDALIRIDRQTRNPSQSEYRVAFTVKDVPDESKP